MAWCQMCYKVYDDPNIIPGGICPICAKKSGMVTQSNITELEKRTKEFIDKIEESYKDTENSKLIFGIYGDRRVIQSDATIMENG